MMFSSALLSLLYTFSDALFLDPPSSRTEADRRSRERQLRQEVIGLLPGLLQRWFFTQDLYTEGANTLVTLFQQPVLNKQVGEMKSDIQIATVYLIFSEDKIAISKIGYTQRSKTHQSV